MLINFKVEARREFDSDMTKMGLHQSYASEFLVKYENARTCFCVNFHNGQSCAINLSAGLVSNEIDYTFTHDEIIRFRRTQNDLDFASIFACNAMDLKSSLSCLHEVAKNYMYDMLVSENVNIWQDLHNFRKNKSISRALERDLQRARASSNIAWRAKDFVTVIASLEPFEIHLTPSESSRLKYARTHLIIP